MAKPVVSLLLDSGAYSAFTRGKVINIDKYIDFCKKYDNEITKSINLDVINPGDPEVAAEAGMKNYFYMRERGVATMPVYHARENLKWLDKMLETADYIGLSATSLVSPVEGKTWHDLVWNYITDAEGRAVVKTHSFGNTELYTMLTYPFYSADSATWMIQGGRAARVKLQGKSYQLRSTSLRDSSYIANDDPAPKKEAWEAEIRELGLDPERVMNVKCTASEMAMIRSYLVASDLIRLQEATRFTSKFKKPRSLFPQNFKGDLKGFARDGPVKMTFAISPSAWYFNLPLLYVLNVKDILASYHYIATAPKTFMEERLVPFLYDPKAFCETQPKLRKYLDKIREVMLKPV